MTQSTLQTRRSERGFTLVELAIVMIIIGLLIGGILKGQELINNARVSSSVTQLKGIEAAVNTFKDKYAALPGDISNASTRLPGCTGAICTTNGNGDGLIQTTGGDLGAAQLTPASGTNETAMFAHLTVASLLTGAVEPNTAWSLQTSLPDFNLGGKIRFGYVPNATAQTGQVATANYTGGHYMAVGNGGAALTASTMSAGDLANIDRKLDDGMPNTGSVYVAGAAGCASAATPAGTYSEQTNPKACGLYVRALN
ncbi:MAG: prepilin-type N-terminal cleavage/methylation domain-containing protein [Alphaproteobacteria bacterium]|nr:prepilin-type N-terminal cleavage/methylation domain-containing protein [Alphaproteobacteria bacterium]